MKLIDLLVQELPKRGGWPKNANYAVQDADGIVKFAKTLTYLHYLAGRWRSNKNGHDWIHGDRSLEGNFAAEWVADDNHSAVISMARYECEISKNEAGKQSADEWNGEGVPPVGCECEISFYGKPLGQCEVLFVGDSIIVWRQKSSQQEDSGHYTHMNIRPLRTKAEMKRDAAVEAMQREADDGDNWIYSEYEIIYDAIAAGKIPGVKLDD